MSHLLKHHYGGWRPSLPDHRQKIADTSGIKVLVDVDPRAALPPVDNQWALGSCTANAAQAAFRYDAILDGKDPGELARLWIYWQERKLEGSLSQGDCGAEGHDAFKVAATVGVPPETAWPYQWQGISQDDPAPAKVFNPVKPPAAAIAGASHYILTKPYAAVPATQLAFKQALSNRQTIAFGFTVYESFESASVEATGVVPMPEQNEQVLGGHETLIVGYLKAHPNYALVRNSWGTSWGLAGYFLMPWSYVLSSALAGDWRTIQRPIGG